MTPGNSVGREFRVWWRRLHPLSGRRHHLFRFQDPAVLEQPGTDEPMALTPDSDAFPDGRYRFADGCLHPSGDSIVLVREDHGPKGDANPKDVVNEVITLKLDGSGEMTVLATGRDFYAHPRLDAAGNMLAYVCWDHPSMPWDATELRVTSVEAAIASPSSGTGTSGGGHRLAAGDTTPLSADGDTSVLQPAWHPTSGALYFISDTSGYWNLMRMEQPDPSADTPLPIAEARTNDLVDHGGSSPGWSFGQQGYTFLPDGRLAAAYLTVRRDAPLLLDDPLTRRPPRRRRSLHRRPVCLIPSARSLPHLTALLFTCSAALLTPQVACTRGEASSAIIRRQGRRARCCVCARKDDRVLKQRGDRCRLHQRALSRRVPRASWHVVWLLLPTNKQALRVQHRGRLTSTSRKGARRAHIMHLDHLQPLHPVLDVPRLCRP